MRGEAQHDGVLHALGPRQCDDDATAQARAGHGSEVGKNSSETIFFKNKIQTLGGFGADSKDRVRSKMR